MNQTTTAATLADIFGAPIHTYTRAQAIEDGALIDVSSIAREAGTRWPVAMTAAAWADTVEWTDADEKRKGYAGQSESGRLWDVCWMLSRRLTSAARQGLQVQAGQAVPFDLLRTPRPGRGVRPRLVRLHAAIGPDDAGRACITVMLPGED